MPDGIRSRSLAEKSPRNDVTAAKPQLDDTILANLSLSPISLHDTSIRVVGAETLGEPDASTLGEPFKCRG